MNISSFERMFVAISSKALTIESSTPASINGLLSLAQNIFDICFFYLPMKQRFLYFLSRIATTIATIRLTRILPHKGLSTQIHDQLITPTSFRTTNTIVKTPKNPTPDDELLLPVELISYSFRLKLSLINFFRRIFIFSAFAKSDDSII